MLLNDLINYSIPDMNRHLLIDAFYIPISTCAHVFQSRARSPSGSHPAQVGSVGGLGSGDQSGWITGQDDSAIHGRHLPPSPRRQCSTRSLPAPFPKVPKDVTDTGISHPSTRNSLPEAPFQAEISNSPGDDAPADLNTPSASQICPDDQQAVPSCALQRKVLSKQTQRHYQQRSQQGRAAGQGSRQTSVFVPWEKEQEEHGEQTEEKESQEKGLLEEIESMCLLKVALNSSLQLTNVQNSAGPDKS